VDVAPLVGSPASPEVAPTIGGLERYLPVGVAIAVVGRGSRVGVGVDLSVRLARAGLRQSQSSWRGARLDGLGGRVGVSVDVSVRLA
jgi:hypothetical protein